MVAAIGVITSPTSTGTTTVELTFTPKLVIFWGDALATADPSAAADASYAMFFGACDATPAQASVSWAQNDGSVAGRMVKRNDHAIYSSDHSANILSATVAYDTFGFTMTWDNVLGTARKLNYLAIGGVDITDVIVVPHAWQVQTTGNKAVTGVGFQPDCVWAVMTDTDAFNDAGAASQGQTPSISISGATRSMILAMKKGADPTNDTSFMRQSAAAHASETNFLSGHDGGSSSATDVDASFVSFDADGFTYNVADADTVERPGFFIAIKGGSWEVCAEATSPATAIAKTITGAGFTPEAVFMLAGGDDGIGTGDNEVSSVIGAAVSATQRAFTQWWSENGINTVNTMKSQRNDRLLDIIDPASVGAAATLEEADFTSFNSDGLVLTYSKAAATGYVLTFLAFDAGIGGSGAFGNEIIFADGITL